MSRSSFRAGVLYLALITACGRDVTFVDPRAATEPDTTGDTTVVVRAPLDVTVSIAAQDTAIARAVGWSGTALAGAAVKVSRVGQPTQEGMTDSAGRVRFEGLVTGAWAVLATRVLTDEERALLPPGMPDVVGFGGAVGVMVEEGGATASITTVVGRTGSVVISEVYAPIFQVPQQASYITGQFFEFYNNGFETAYLDGMVVGILEYPSDNILETCEQRAVWLEDPEGLWVRYFHRFPGSGRDYPLAPGQAVVAATDAIDHRQYVPGLLDLSGASFEFLGSADVDNPAVPNLIDIGTWEMILGHGLLIPGGTVFGLFLSAPVDPDTLPQVLTPFNFTNVRIPRAAVLDVVTSWPTPEVEAGLPPAIDFCPRMVNEVFDLQPARLYDSYNLSLSVRRRVFATSPRIFLQRTGSSAADLEGAGPSPGRVP